MHIVAVKPNDLGIRKMITRVHIKENYNCFALFFFADTLYNSIEKRLSILERLSVKCSDERTGSRFSS